MMRKAVKFSRRWKCWLGWFHDETFGFTVHFLWGIDGPGLKRYCEHAFPTGSVDLDDSDDWCGRHAKVTFEDKKKSYEVHVIALQDFKLNAFWISVLAHEVLHCTQSVLDGRGLQQDDDTCEAYTYVHDFLIRRCLELVEKSKK